jgi:hypothetical protein
MERGCHETDICGTVRQRNEFVQIGFYGPYAGKPTGCNPILCLAERLSPGIDREDLTPPPDPLCQFNGVIATSASQVDNRQGQEGGKCFKKQADIDEVKAALACPVRPLPVAHSH